MKSWQQARTLLLAGTFGGILFTLLLTLFKSSSAFRFPSHVPLSGWSLVNQTALNSHPQPIDGVVGKVVGQRYQYTATNQTLNIEMRLLPTTDGDLSKLLGSFNAIALPPNQTPTHYQPTIGHYGLFSYQDRAYLTACINPRGGTTFTKEQFSDQRNTSMMQFDRILLWLIGKEDLRDWRCLWVNMSTPVQQSNPQAAYVILQDTWKDWYSWWSPRWP